MRPELLTPKDEIIPATLRDMLALVGCKGATTEQIEKWAPLEQAVVYDWAAREYLHASDNPVRRRPRPSLIGDAEPASPLEEIQRLRRLAIDVLRTFRGAHHGDSRRSDVAQSTYDKWCERAERRPA